MQLSLNFLDAVFRGAWPGVRLFVLLPDSGELARYAVPLPAGRRLHSPSAPLRRAWFEHVTLQGFIRRNGIRVIKTLFGAGLPHGGSVMSIVGMAYPIICYPDSPYWRHRPWLDKTRQRLKNGLRRWRLRQADRVLVETPVMQRRVARHCGIGTDRLQVLPPAPSTYLSRTARRRDAGEPMAFLFLSGASPHKNLWRLPAIAAELRHLGAGGAFKFLVSCDATALDDAFKGFQHTRGHFDFHGPVASRDIQRLYDRADVLVNLSDLESFSNNYMEAWRARIPILASDRDFAHEICGDSALYCEPHDVREVAERMQAFICAKVDTDALIAGGVERLSALHTQETRTAHIRRMLLCLAMQGGAAC
ncbi:glycosyltransferase family 4 protein [Bordetella bronchialis]|uniref:glycosyltransferase family 4 protein n=1 Tax=Bordetella bronchialis TaxID=463025 RepID=UPI003CFD5633